MQPFNQPGVKQAISEGMPRASLCTGHETPKTKRENPRELPYCESPRGRPCATGALVIARGTQRGG